MKRIGIMGGTFNPIHMGHMILAQTALDECRLDEVIFIPSKIPAYKKNNDILDSKMRYLMVKEAIADNDKFSISSIDINREGYTYTLDTLQDLAKEYKDANFYFIIGADSLFTLDQWYHFDEVARLCSFVVASRPGEDNDKILDTINQLKDKYNVDIYVINMPLMEISSTDIRKRMCNGDSFRYLVPEKVFNMILDNNVIIKKCWSCENNE